MSGQSSTGTGRGWDVTETQEVGFVESTQSFMDFISEWKAEGFWRAMYDKPFSQVAGDAMKEMAHDTSVFILSHGDLFFLMPALFFIIGTFMIGKHKYTKWIIPLSFLYFVSRIFFYMFK
jgi:Na+-translocating ferredoxin:NAD+ oxidoreductase RnfD subunit